MERFMNGEDVDAERSVSPQYALDFDVPSVFMPGKNKLSFFSLQMSYTF